MVSLTARLLRVSSLLLMGEMILRKGFLSEGVKFDIASRMAGLGERVPGCVTCARGAEDEKRFSSAAIIYRG